MDHLEGILVHLQNHDNTYAAVARAPIEEIEVVRKRMGWKFPWVSSYHSDFNYDFNVRARQAPYRIETDQHGHIIMSPLTGFLGVGGGFLLVPAMILFARLPMAVAVGTSLAVIAANSFAGWLGHLGREPFAWGMTGAFLVAALVGMASGARLGGRIAPVTMRRAFGWFVLAVAIFVLVNH